MSVAMSVAMMLRVTYLYMQVDAIHIHAALERFLRHSVRSLCSCCSPSSCLAKHPIIPIYASASQRKVRLPDLQLFLYTCMFCSQNHCSLFPRGTPNLRGAPVPISQKHCRISTGLNRPPTSQSSAMPSRPPILVVSFCVLNLQRSVCMLPSMRSYRSHAGSWHTWTCLDMDP